MSSWCLCITVGPQQQQPGVQEQEQEMLTGECLNRRNQRHQPLTETLQLNDKTTTQWLYIRVQNNHAAWSGQ